MICCWTSLLSSAQDSSRTLSRSSSPESALYCALPCFKSGVFCGEEDTGSSPCGGIPAVGTVSHGSAGTGNSGSFLCAAGGVCEPKRAGAAPDSWRNVYQVRRILRLQRMAGLGKSSGSVNIGKLQPVQLGTGKLRGTGKADDCSNLYEDKD